MELSFIQIALILIVTMIAAIDKFNFLESFYRPIIIGPIIGAIMGDLQTGLIVTGSIMPILPGIIITYAFRDSINGDYISGSAGLLEALLSAVSLAGGVGFIINIFLSLNVEIGRLNV